MIKIATVRVGARGGSFCVTLPRSWCREMKIAPGDALAVYTDEDGALTFMTASENDVPEWMTKRRPLEVRHYVLPAH